MFDPSTRSIHFRQSQSKAIIPFRSGSILSASRIKAIGPMKRPLAIAQLVVM